MMMPRPYALGFAVGTFPSHCGGGIPQPPEDPAAPFIGIQAVDR